jgi:rod shape-determining protein MreD
LYLKRTYLALFLALVAEMASAPLFPLPRYFPHLAILVLVYAALQEGGMQGFKFGLWTGLLLDLVSLEHLGTYTFLYGVVGGLCGALRGKVFAESFLSQCLIPTGAYLAVLTAVFLSTPFLDEPQNRLPLFWSMVKNSALLTTTLLAPLGFILCDRLLRKRRLEPRRLFIS